MDYQSKQNTTQFAQIYAWHGKAMNTADHSQ